MTAHRFFIAPVGAYEAMRAQIDAAWGYPTAHTQTSIPPAAEQHKTQDGECVLGVFAEYCDWPPVPTLLADAQAAGVLREITEAEYWAIVQPGPGPG